MSKNCAFLQKLVKIIEIKVIVTKKKKAPNTLGTLNNQNYALFLFLLIAAFCFFFFLTLGFSYCSCFLRSPITPSFWHFLLNLLIAFSTLSVSPTLTVDNFFTHFCFKILYYYIEKRLIVKCFMTKTYFFKLYYKQIKNIMKFSNLYKFYQDRNQVY